MAKRLEDRFQTASEFKSALMLAAESPFPTSASSADNAATADATLKLSRPMQNQLKSIVVTSSFVDFNQDDFDVRLQETQQEANRRSGILGSEESPDNSLRDINLEFHRMTSEKEIGTKSEIVAQQSSEAPLPVILTDFIAESGLLAELAREAKEKTSSRHYTLQENQAKARLVDEALNRIIKFFNPFIRDVNEVEPSINRIYRYDAWTIYSNLRWRGAIIDRKSVV